MKEIILTQGKVAIVDDEDFWWLTEWDWFYLKGYAYRTLKNQTPGMMPMHGQILHRPAGYECDHINGDTLNNTRENLRICTRSQNQHNGKPRKGTSIYKGVSWHNASKKWQVVIKNNYKQKHIGLFISEIEAVEAYNEAAIKYHGEFARLNEMG